MTKMHAVIAGGREGALTSQQRVGRVPHPREAQTIEAAWIRVVTLILEQRGVWRPHPGAFGDVQTIGEGKGLESDAFERGCVEGGCLSDSRWSRNLA